MINDIVVVNRKVLQIRNLACYDYEDFIELTKIKINKYDYLDNYINDKNIKVIIIVNVLNLKIVALSLYENNKLKKIIFDKKYDSDALMKYLIVKFK